MKIGIDASNIRAGGGIAHLSGVLRAAYPLESGIQKVVVWGSASTLSRLPEQPWLKKIHVAMLDGPLYKRLYWQRAKRRSAVEEERCVLLFLPGTANPHGFKPSVTMVRNMLPFEANERRRFAPSRMYIRLCLLKWGQTQALKAAQGVIFLSSYSYNVVMGQIPSLKTTPRALISHGVDQRFYCKPRPSKEIKHYSTETPFKLLYVSDVTMYKHQWHLVEAMALLRQKGYPIQLDLVGGVSSHRGGIKRLTRALDTFDPNREFVRLKGKHGFDSLHEKYHQADMFLFASTCETLPNILLEAMASGLPIASTDRDLMREVLGPEALYFNAENPSDIALQVERAILSPNLRERIAEAVYDRAQSYSWERCAQETFIFFNQICHYTKLTVGNSSVERFSS